MHSHPPCKNGHITIPSKRFDLHCFRCTVCGFNYVIPPQFKPYKRRQETISACLLGTTITIDTITEGELTFYPEDYVIMDHDEGYLCKKDEFEKAYLPIREF